MLYLTRWGFLGMLGLCILQSHSLYSAAKAPEQKPTPDYNFVPPFKGSLPAKQMDAALLHQVYTSLKTDLYDKTDYNVHGVMDWVSSRLDFNQHPETAYDPLLLYFALRDGYLDISERRADPLLKQLYYSYKAFFSLSIVAFAHTYTAMKLGHAENALKIYNFLMNKLGTDWLTVFKLFFDPRLGFYQYDHQTEKEPKDIITELKKAIIIDRGSGTARGVNPQFLKCLKSGEWIACSECGEDFYFAKKTIVFKEPSQQIREQYSREKNPTIIQQAYIESILKIMEVLETLKGTTAEKAIQLAKMTFSEVWQR